MLAFIKHCHHSLKGLAAVAGIVSILFVHLAFTIFLKTSALFAESEALVRNAEVVFYPTGLQKRPSIARIPSDHAADILSGGDREVSIARPRFRTERAFYNIGAVDRKERKARPIRKSDKPVPKVIFTDTIIEIAYSPSNRKQRSEVREGSSENTASSEPKPTIIKDTPEKRSFVASVLPIVKRPYGWMKAIGSKIF